MSDGEDIEPHVVKLRDDAAGWGKVNGPTLTPEEPFLTGLSEADADAWVDRNWALEHSTPEDAAAFRDDADADEVTVSSGESEPPETPAGEDDSTSSDTPKKESPSEFGTSGSDLTDLDGVGPARADDLREAGYETLDDVRAASLADLAEVSGVTEESAQSYHDQLTTDEGE